MPRALHVLSQRPLLTGSGVTVDALVRQAALRGWEQRVVFAQPVGQRIPAVGGLDPRRLDPLLFGDAGASIPFAIPGMSDVMPYPSRRFSSLDGEELGTYREAWRRHLRRVVESYEPDVIHTHHVWLLSSWLRELAPNSRLVIHSHATGLRQMRTCPTLADRVIAGCKEADAFAVLHEEQRRTLAARLHVAPDVVHVVGAGYREELFRGPPGSGEGRARRLLYAGKLSRSKGVLELLESFDALHTQHPELELRIAGTGSGDEADAIERAMAARAPHVVRLGSLSQEALAEEMRAAALFVLPSFYEGLPLVLVEALACGCRIVATALDGVRGPIASAGGDAVELVPLPPLIGIDRPSPSERGDFVAKLTSTLARSVDAARTQTSPSLPAEALAPFTWNRVFRRIEALWTA